MQQYITSFLCKGSIKCLPLHIHSQLSVGNNPEAQPISKKSSKDDQKFIWKSRHSSSSIFSTITRLSSDQSSITEMICRLTFAYKMKIPMFRDFVKPLVSKHCGGWAAAFWLKAFNISFYSFNVVCILSFCSSLSECMITSFCQYALSLFSPCLTRGGVLAEMYP